MAHKSKNPRPRMRKRSISKPSVGVSHKGTHSRARYASAFLGLDFGLRDRKRDTRTQPLRRGHQRRRS